MRFSPPLASITMSAISLFEEKQVRRAWNAREEKWMFAIVDVIAILTESADPGAYWRKLKERLKKEGNETVTNCHGLKMTAADGKQRMTDVADTEQLLRLIQSVPSPKAEPFKRWLAKVGFERLEEIENPELAAKRARAIYEQKGYSEEWIEKRLRGIAVRDELTEALASDATALAEYDLTADDATLLGKDLADCEKITADPAAAISPRRSLTVTLRPKFQGISQLLKKIYRLVLRLRRTEPGTAFAAAWQASRIIRDLGTAAPGEPEPVIPAA